MLRTARRVSSCELEKECGDGELVSWGREVCGEVFEARFLFMLRKSIGVRRRR